MKIYDFTVKNRKGEDISLENYKGKVLLIVNTATRCGFTPQYDELEALYSKYNKDGIAFSPLTSTFANWSNLTL